MRPLARVLLLCATLSITAHNSKAVANDTPKHSHGYLINVLHQKTLNLRDHQNHQKPFLSDDKNTRQQWQLVQKPGGYYHILNLETGAHLLPITSQNNAKVIAKPNYFDGARTQWHQRHRGKQVFSLENRWAGGQYLSVQTSSDGTQNIVLSDNRGPASLWRFGRPQAQITPNKGSLEFITTKQDCNKQAMIRNVITFRALAPTLTITANYGTIIDNQDGTLKLRHTHNQFSDTFTYVITATHTNQTISTLEKSIMTKNRCAETPPGTP